MNLDLTKQDNTLEVLKIGLGWQTKYDLDVMAFLTNNKGQIKETVCYQKLNGHGVDLDDDKLSGGLNVDQETLTVKLNEIPEDITQIQICVNIFCARPERQTFGLFGRKKTLKGDSFSEVKGSYVRLYNAISNEEICKYNLEEDGSNYTAFHFANLYKTENNEWIVEILGKGMNGSIESLRRQLQNLSA